MQGADGSETLLLRAGQETAEGAWAATAGHGQPAARQPWPRDGGGWDYLARAGWDEPLLPQQITVRNLAAQGELVLRGVSLLDSRTSAHAALTMPADGQFRRVHSGDVKVYQNVQALPRAYVAGRALVADDDGAALAAMDAAGFEPAQQVVLLAEELAAAGLLEQAAQLDGHAAAAPVHVVSYRPEAVALDVTLDEHGALVLADTWYPGWQVTVNGRPAALLRANYLLRAVLLPAGQHSVLFEYRPATLRRGAALSLAAALAAVILVGAGAFWQSRRRPALVG